MLDRKLDYWFLISYAISMLSLAFWRPTFLGYYVPLPFLIFAIYAFIKLALQFTKGDIKLRDYTVAFLLFIFLIPGVIASVFALDFGLRNLVELIIYVLFTVFFIQCVRYIDVVEIEKVIRLLVIILTTLGLIGLYGYFTGQCINGQFTWMFLQQEGNTLLGSRNVDIYVIFPAIIFALSFIAFKKASFSQYLVVISMGGSLFFSFSRGAILLSIGFLLLTGFIFVKIKKNRFLQYRKIGALGILIVFLLVYFLNYTQAYDRLLSRFKEVGSSPRIELFMESFTIMFEHPLTGIGISNYRDYTSFTSENGPIPNPLPNPHNAYTTYGAETGFLGFFAIIMVIFFPFIRFYKLGKSMKRSLISIEQLTLFHAGKMLSLYLILVNFLLPFHLDAGYSFWFYYSLSMLIYHVIKKSIINTTRYHNI